MNADRLLAHFRQIADAHDAISRLRCFVFDLAVRGRLVDQDNSDEPAAELLKRIAAEKARLVKTRELRKPKDLPELPDDKLPFPLPPKWRWSQIAEIGAISPRNNVPDRLTASFVSMPMISTEYGVEHEHQPRPWAMIKKGYTHFAEGDVGLAKITPCFENGKSTVFRYLTGGLGSGTTELHIVRPLLVNPDYIIIFLKCPYFIQTGIEKMTGTAGQKRVPAEYFANSPFPLPPLAEQHRIVAKVDELMVLCDQLEASRMEWDTTRDRLATASLARFNAPDPDPVAFQNHAAFALENLTPLTTHPDQINALRQTILNLAIRGKLIAQDPNDEPASKILDRIQTKRKKLYAAKLIRKPKKLPSLEDVDNLWSLPEGWTWSMLGELCYQISDGPHFSPQYVPADEGVPFLSTRNVQIDGFDLTSVKYVSRKDHEEFCKRIRPEGNDIIYTKGGTTGIAKLNDLDMEFSVWVHLAVLRIDKEWILPRYVEVALNSTHCYEQSQKYTRGTSNFDLGLTRMVKITVPLPPLAEQHRIVAKVRELTALCDRLEERLVAGGDTRRRLLDAVLDEALVPGADPIATT